MQKHPLIIIPTYNEATNVIRMIHTLMALDMKVDILFVDDGSPDGTAERIKEQQQANPDRIHCLLYTSPSPRDKTVSRMPSSA